MHIESVSITGFRCFGPAVTVVELDAGLTAVVGPNASGKTALLSALMRLFGVTRSQRTVVPSDFHVPPSETTRPSSRALSIDVRIALPELLLPGAAKATTIAPVFRHMRIKRLGSVPVCRMRLEARWDDDGTVDGAVTQELQWISSLDDVVEKEQVSSVGASDRGLIQLFYTPASRDAEAQIRASTGALAARLLKAIEWSTGARTTIETATKSLSDAFGGEEAIKAIGKAMNTRWEGLHDGDTDCAPELSLTSRRFEEVIARIGVVFKRGPTGVDRGLESLSDGQQSLFYFALAAAVFDVERDAVSGKVAGFRADDLHIPALTLFAVEEPENHLAPYYLSRIINQLESLVAGGAGQAIVSSHSPSVLSRIEPQKVRYCRREASTGSSTVRRVPLPTGEVEAIKFVRNAMLAFPELYFARFVLLVEGDSERIVLPKIAEAMGQVFDPSFVAIVPLGGRHVQHFWRLLMGLDIPFATLLDLDLGRAGGGYGRLKNVFDHALDLGRPRAEILRLADGTTMSDATFAAMPSWGMVTKAEQEQMVGWLDYLETSSNVFFSWPLDLDMAMLTSFPDAYKATIEGTGPRMTNLDAAAVVLGTGGLGLAAYIEEAEPFKEHMAAYRYHFLTHSKPATHLRALTHVESEALRDNSPETLRSVVNHIASKLPSLF
jgi:putative ATP-dependent endonuclease of the OLD family